MSKANLLPETLFAEISVKSLGGISLFDEKELVTSENVENFFSDDSLIDEALKELKNKGFEVLQVGDATINICAPPKIFEEIFKTTIEPQDRNVIKEGAIETTSTFLECIDTKLPGLISTKGSSFENLIEGIAINDPVYYFQSSPTPPQKEYWYLGVPTPLRDALNAKQANDDGINGNNVNVIMVDSGWYRHPFFVQNNYNGNVILGPSASNPDHDESGHGTGESANIFSVAPKVNFTMVKMSFVNSVGAFNAAAVLNPNIISCSWGQSREVLPLSASQVTLSAAISAAVLRGIIVVFAAGNGHWGYPGQHPDVISAGGVYMERDGRLQASDYSSGFKSKIFEKRIVPDLSGLVGMRPSAAYIMLPVEPGDTMDVSHAGGTHPQKDETLPDDGWAAFSGTSAAAPQIAGVCALIRQVCPNFSPKLIRRILKNTARDVTEGNVHSATGGNQAKIGYDEATGAGLVDASKAVRIAKRMCRG